MKKKSKFGKIDKIDLLDAIYDGCGACSFAIGVLIAIPTKNNLLALLSAFVGGFMFKLFKSGVSNSDGKMFKKEQKTNMEDAL